MDPVKLHAGIGGPVPVQTQRKTFPNATEYVFIVEVGIRIAPRDLPGSPAVANAAIADVDEEEIFVGLNPA